MLFSFQRILPKLPPITTVPRFASPSLSRNYKLIRLGKKYPTQASYVILFIFWCREHERTRRRISAAQNEGAMGEHEASETPSPNENPFLVPLLSLNPFFLRILLLILLLWLDSGFDGGQRISNSCCRG